MVYFILPIGVRQGDKAKKPRRMVGWGLIPQGLSYPFVMWRLQVLSEISHSKHVVLHLKVTIYQLEYWTVMEGKIREQDFPEMPLVLWRTTESMLIPSPQEGGCQGSAALSVWTGPHISLVLHPHGQSPWQWLCTMETEQSTEQGQAGAVKWG